MVGTIMPKSKYKRGSYGGRKAGSNMSTAQKGAQEMGGTGATKSSNTKGWGPGITKVKGSNKRSYIASDRYK